ncbi:tetrahydromethanopterin S-methyltransferase subunit A [Peptococcaceae bacterium CEB3]|nr:tetrahydromethanopterin S-methyltransferase subunit A [Peptococcaceae bacterium CEB3]
MFEDAITKAWDQLNEIRQIKKCRSCECLLDTLEAIRGDLQDIDASNAKDIRVEMSEWFEDGNINRHPCLGCEDCLPIEPYNQFSKSIRGISTHVQEQGLFTMLGSSCGCGHSNAPEPIQQNIDKWPVVEGNYQVGRQNSKVAVCTLADSDLLEEIEHAGLLEQVAIVGTLATENLGIERLIRNIVTNPSIRFLILCGKDSRGHKAGQAVLSLKSSGINEQRQILGAVGPRPILKNLSQVELKAFANYVTVIDEIGTHDIDRLRNVINTCNAQPEGSELILAPKVHLPKTVEVEKSSKWEPDPEGYFLVLIDWDARKIICEHYTNDHLLNEVIRGDRASDIVNTVIKRGLLSRLDHAGYLGGELAKAEAALVLKTKYVQDEAAKPALPPRAKTYLKKARWAHSREGSI